MKNSLLPRLLLAAILFAVANASSATQAFAKAFEPTLAPDARASFERADRALVVSDFATAARELERVASLAPDHPNSYALYAYALSSLDASRVAATAERYRRLAEAEPARAAYWYAYGRFEADRAKREAAFRRVVELEPEAPWGYLGLGFAARLANELEAARVFYEKAHALAPSEPSTMAGLVSLYAATNRKPEALALMKRVVEAAPGSFWAENAVDSVSAGLEGEEELRALAAFYIRHFPQGKDLGKAHTIVLRGVAAKSRTEALGRAREVLETLTGAYYARARGEIFGEFVLQPTVEKDRPAVDALAAERLASSESSPYVFFRLARYYAARPEGAEMAGRLFARAVELHGAVAGSDPKFSGELFWAYGRHVMRVGNDALAIELLERVAIDHADASRAAAALAALYTKRGNAEEAFRASVRLAALEPLPENVAALTLAAKRTERTPADADAAVWAVRESLATPAADFTLAALDGRPVSLSSHRGKVVLLNFWFPG